MFSFAVKNTISSIYNFRSSLITTSKFEMRKRYAGSFLGKVWIFLYPVLFLSVYLFLYLAVLKTSYPAMNRIETVVYIFSGLVPYIAFMETMNSSSTVLKQNLHLIRNVILPVELVPARVVLVAMTTQVIGLLMIFALCAIDNNLSAKLLLLPVALLIEFFFIFGLALLVSPLGLVVPDLSYFISLLMLLLLFVSPIGFVTTMLSGKLMWVIDFNPIYYIIEPFRMVFLKNNAINYQVLLIGVGVSLLFFVVGALVFSKFKDFVAEYE